MPHPPVLLLALCIAAAPAACGGRGDPTPAPSASPDQSSAVPQPPPPLSHLLRQQHSGYHLPSETVIRDGAAWERAWRLLEGGEGAEVAGAAPASPLPAVDFAREMVVLVALGDRNTGGYSVNVDAVTRDGAGVLVRYTATEPGAGCMSAEVITAPVDVVRAPRMDGAVRFERAVVRQPC